MAKYETMARPRTVPDSLHVSILALRIAITVAICEWTLEGINRYKRENVQVEQTCALFDAERDQKDTQKTDCKEGKDDPEGRHAALVGTDENVLELGRLYISIICLSSKGRIDIQQER